MAVRLIYEPTGKPRLGDVLSSLLRGGDIWKEFRAAVAFVKASGVRHLASPLQGFVDGGGKVKIVVGVDHRGTSIEGLAMLLKVVGSVGEIWVFHNENPSTFHPKLYLFEGTGKATVVVGSGNLSEGGLFTNYEANIYIEIDLKDEEGKRFLSEVHSFLEGLADPESSLARRLDVDFLEELERRGYICHEQQSRDDAEEQKSPSPGAEPPKKESLFPRVAVPAAPKAPPLGKKKRQVAARRRAAVTPAPARGPLVWEKRSLPPTDAQRQSGNPTGNLRLSGAGWKVAGQPIDHTKYFRNDIFGSFPWKTAQQVPLKEVTSIAFHVSLLGSDLGAYELQISHQPSRVSGQSNVSTVLHWKELGQVVKNANVVGKTVRLYGPPAGSKEPFFLEIV